MFISELIIEEFASLKNQRIRLDRSFNLITGENETGKSTVSAFIKFIFYGFSDSKERERFASLQTGIARGAMLIESNGKIYRIERRTAAKEQPVTVYDESDGTEFKEWKAVAKTPGDYFLSVSESLYTRSVYVSQASGARLDGGTAEAISNLLLTGDEALNLKRAKKKLDDARKSLKLKRGSGGMIYECEKRISELEMQKNEAIAKKKQLEGISIALQSEKKQAELLKNRLDNAVTARKTQKAERILGQLDRLCEVINQKEKNEAVLNMLEEDFSYLGFTPDDSYEKELTSLQGEISFYERELKQNESRLSALKAQSNAVPPSGYDEYCRLGKTETILPLYKRKATLLKAFGIAFLSSCLLLLVATVAFALQCLGVLENANFSVIPLIVIFGVTTLLFGILRLLPKKAVASLCEKLYADSSHTVNDVCRACELYEQSTNASGGEYIAETITDLNSKLKGLNEKISYLLNRWNKPSVDTAVTEYRRYTERIKELKGLITELEKEANSIKANLSEYTEAELTEAQTLKGNATVGPQGVVSEADIEFLKCELDASNEKCKKYEIELAQSGHLPSTDIIAGEIASEKDKLSDLRFKYEAINLAIESLDEAERTIRSKVSPYLGKQASKYFSEITNGKYCSLRIDSEMNISSESSENGNLLTQEYFSGGSADLAWLCLRLALHKRLSENESIPLILDEALVYFDDTRLSLILKELYEKSLNGVQIICFSASLRELYALNKAVNHIKL